MEQFRRRRSDAQGRRCTAVPKPVISAALYGRFDSRGQADFADRLLSVMRWQFGGHQEK